MLKTSPHVNFAMITVFVSTLVMHFSVNYRLTIIITFLNINWVEYIFNLPVSICIAHFPFAFDVTLFERYVPDRAWNVAAI